MLHAWLSLSQFEMWKTEGRRWGVRGGRGEGFTGLGFNRMEYSCSLSFSCCFCLGGAGAGLTVDSGIMLELRSDCRRFEAAFVTISSRTFRPGPSSHSVINKVSPLYKYHCRELPQVSYLSRQTLVCCDKTCLLSQQKYACHHKTFVATKYFCREKYVFVATKDLFWRDKSKLVATKRLLRQIMCMRSRRGDSGRRNEVILRAN